MEWTQKNAQLSNVPKKWQWFNQGRYGLIIHWGPYAQYGRGEQVLFREHLNPCEYEKAACAWNPSSFDARQWARQARQAGFRYAMLTTRHHDGYCLWDSQLTDYSSAAQAPKRDFVREYCDAFRAEGIRVGLYYSLLDWRIPAYWQGPQRNPAGWQAFREYVHGQIRELLTSYGKIDQLGFDGCWPHYAEDWDSDGIVAMARELQPDIMINNRLGPRRGQPFQVNVNTSPDIGDYGTPEHEITSEERLWESWQVSTWRLWCWTRGERWRSADYLLDMLCQCASQGGNLMLNVGPTPEGELPPEFLQRADVIGDWLNVHGEAIYGSEPGNFTEAVTYGWQTRKGGDLYLIFRFWPGLSEFRVPDLVNLPAGATLLTTGAELECELCEDGLLLKGLPEQSPTSLFPVVRLRYEEAPQRNRWGEERLWQGDPLWRADWARQRGDSVHAYQG